MRPRSRPPGSGPSVTSRPVPDGFRLVLDPQARRVDGGSVVIGGSPLTVLRLKPAGARLLDDLVAGDPVPPQRAGNRLARRLLDLGLGHPRPPIRFLSSVTVVIPVRDDPAGLAATLAHLDPVSDVVVVDDGSVDPSAVSAVAAAHGVGQVIRLQPSQGPAAARQAGWRAAATDVVAFLDAGCRPHPGWLDVLSAHLADPAVAAAAPRVVAWAPPEAPSWLAAYEALHSPLDLGPALAVVRPRSRVPYVPTAALVLRRDALVAVGGFDVTLRTGEDVDLVWRLAAAGWTVRYDPTATVGHPVRPTLRALLGQRFDYGRSAAPLAARHGPAAAPLAVPASTAAAWVIAGTGHPVLAAIVAGVPVAGLVARLRALDHPWAEAARLGAAGHRSAGRLLVEACRRSWWPVLALASIASRRARRATLVLALLPPLLDRRRATNAAAWLALRLLDDLAYGTGVWAGALQARSPATLLPDVARRR